MIGLESDKKGSQSDGEGNAMVVICFDKKIWLGSDNKIGLGSA